MSRQRKGTSTGQSTVFRNRGRWSILTRLQTDFRALEHDESRRLSSGDAKPKLGLSFTKHVLFRPFSTLSLLVRLDCAFILDWTKLRWPRIGCASISRLMRSNG